MNVSSNIQLFPDCPQDRRSKLLGRMPGHDALPAVQVDLGVMAAFREGRPQTRQIPPKLALLHAYVLSRNFDYKQKC
jgi:hypothetical protein